MKTKTIKAHSTKALAEKLALDGKARDNKTLTTRGLTVV